MKKNTIILTLLFIAFTVVCHAVPIKDEELTNDIITVKYEKKDARLAMVMSAILPGAGQFYGNKASWTTYLFPILEAGFIYGMIYFDDKGKDKERAYERYANQEVIQDTIGNVVYTGVRYRREFQSAAELSIMGVHQEDIYDNTLFRLGSQNNQEFYEDIGKYDKYIFGWVDWYYKYAYDGSNPTAPIWVWSPDAQTATHQWIGNYPTNPAFIVTGQTYDTPYSPLRAPYIQMRKDAEKEYDKATTMSFLIAANHIAAALDAVRVTNARNRAYLSELPIKLNYATVLKSNKLTPTLFLTAKF